MITIRGPKVDGTRCGDTCIHILHTEVQLLVIVSAWRYSANSNINFSAPEFIDHPTHEPFVTFAASMKMRKSEKQCVAIHTAQHGTGYAYVKFTVNCIRRAIVLRIFISIPSRRTLPTSFGESKLSLLSTNGINLMVATRIGQLFNNRGT